MPVAPNRGGTGGEFGGFGGGSSGAPSGGAGGGGSAPGGGVSGTPTAQPGPGSGAASHISSQMIDVSRGAADRTEYGPAIFLGPNDSVQVMPRRSNTQPCFISTQGNSDAKSVGNRLQLSNTDNPVPVIVRTLREIGVYSTIPGEGVTIILGRRA